MPSRRRIQKPHHRRGEEPAPELQARGQELAHDLDDILDEVDAVLEENAQEFVQSYVQKGGE